MMKKLMEKCRMIRENQKKNGTKGFSMVELIIVIAIMAILIALIGTQLIPYLEKSRVSKDLNTLDTAKTAIQSIIVDRELKPGDTDLQEDSDIALDGWAYEADFKTYTGFDGDTQADKFASNAAGSGEITFRVTTDGEITVKAGNLSVSSTGESSSGS